MIHYGQVDNVPFDPWMTLHSRLSQINARTSFIVAGGVSKRGRRVFYELPIHPAMMRINGQLSHFVLCDCRRVVYLVVCRFCLH